MPTVKKAAQKTAAKAKISIQKNSNGKAPKEFVDAMTGLTKKKILQAYRTMYLSRKLDEKQLTYSKQGKQFFHIGAPGHESAQIAVAMAMKPGYDWAYPYYRDITFALGFGETAKDILLSALHRAEDPNHGGRMMPCHYSSKALHIPSQSSCTGTQFLEAVGTAMGAKKNGSDEIVYTSSGEGTTSEGEFWEALNWSTRDKLPVLFHIQNNRFSISVPLHEQVTTGSIFTLTEGYKGLHRYHANGVDFFEMYATATDAIKKLRSGEGPVLIWSDCVRLFSHSSSDDQKKYRAQEEMDEDKKKDPIPRFEKYLLENKLLSEKELVALQEEVVKEMNEAADYAEQSPEPDPSTSQLHIYSSNEVIAKENFVEPEHTGNNIVLVDAINHALAEELQNNPKMLIFGEDVAGKKGGVFTSTRGLTDKFGAERVFNSPIAEASIAGLAMGLALRGDFKPVVEIQFGDYIWPAFMQIRNEIAMLRYRSNGAWGCPLVIRVATGGYIHGGVYHSQSIETFFTHIPGLRVVFPSTAADAKGLLKYACRCDDPVIFLEHKGMYRQNFAATPEPDSNYLLPFGIAKVKKEGDDITILTYGMMVQRSLEAARTMEEKGVSVEVVDLRTLNPLDHDTILKSVKKTGKVLCVHEENLFSGFGGELAAIVASEAFEYLDGPIMRVAAKDSPVPYAPTIENDVLPQMNDILNALEKLAAY
jgi:2-oxoisovalerate dehydrogenase E1 component